MTYPPQCHYILQHKICSIKYAFYCCNILTVNFGLDLLISLIALVKHILVHLQSDLVVITAGREGFVALLKNEFFFMILRPKIMEPSTCRGETVEERGHCLPGGGAVVAVAGGARHVPAHHRLQPQRGVLELILLQSLVLD